MPAAEPSLTRQLARWQCAQRRRGFGAGLRVQAAQFLLDWLGCALAGCATPSGRRFLDYAADAAAGPAWVVGGDGGRSAEVAALVNGALSHIVEMDDVHRESVLHPAAVVMPAALAAAHAAAYAATQAPPPPLATRVPAAITGQDLLDAVIAGYEAMIRVGEAVGRRHYYHFHNTATCGVFGAAAAAGWLYRLDEDALTHAFGNAGTQAAGLWQFNAEGVDTKPLHPGRAAAAGVLAADLAARGFTGAEQILEGARGLFAGMAPDAEPARVVAGLGSDALRITRNTLKPHASCRHTHAPIDAALELRAAHGVPDPADVEALDIATYAAALDLCDRPEPGSEAEAKFSLQYCVATALVHGDAGLEAFAGPRRADPGTRAQMARIHPRVDPHRDGLYPVTWSAELTLQQRDGSVQRAVQEQPKGDPENPLSAAEVVAKFMGLAVAGGHTEAAAQALRQWVEALPHGTQPLAAPPG